MANFSLQYQYLSNRQVLWELGRRSVRNIVLTHHQTLSVDIKKRKKNEWHSITKTLICLILVNYVYFILPKFEQQHGWKKNPQEQCNIFLLFFIKCTYQLTDQFISSSWREPTDKNYLSSALSTKTSTCFPILFGGVRNLTFISIKIMSSVIYNAIFHVKRKKNHCKITISFKCSERQLHQ